MTNSAWLEDASAQPIDQCGFMASGEVKVIDNAVVGSCRNEGRRKPKAAPQLRGPLGIRLSCNSVRGPLSSSCSPDQSGQELLAAHHDSRYQEPPGRADPDERDGHSVVLRQLIRVIDGIVSEDKRALQADDFGEDLIHSGLLSLHSPKRPLPAL